MHSQSSDRQKTKEQLISELVELRQQVIKLKTQQQHQHTEEQQGHIAIAEAIASRLLSIITARRGKKSLFL